MNREKVYFKMEKKKSIDIKKNVLVEDLGDVYCFNGKTQRDVEKLMIKEKSLEENWDCITAIQVTKKILDTYPNIDLDVIGETEILIEYKSQEQTNKIFEFLKVLTICIILFFGSSLALINFHEDVDTRSSIEKLYTVFTGEEKENPLIMAIPYSLGIGIGVMAFFTRIFSSSKRRTKEPGPMEIELYIYDQDMEEEIINEIKKNNES